MQPQLIYIAGISPRSGTNWLFNLIAQHPDCTKGLAEEDNFLRFAHLLTSYTDELRRSWFSRWTARRAGADKLVLRAFGDGLQRVLRVGTCDGFVEDQVGLRRDPEEWPSTSKVVVTKSPYVVNLHLFPELFPHGRLIVVVRDGRAVVESGMRSFGWTFTTAARRWRDAARLIDAFDRGQRDKSWYRIVRYEDVVNDVTGELEELFDFLGLDSAAYDFRSAQESPVVGSSTYGKAGESVHWNPVDKSDSFDPTQRWRLWSGLRHARFNDIAGDELRLFGYVPLNGSGHPIRRALHLPAAIREALTTGLGARYPVARRPRPFGHYSLNGIQDGKAMHVRWKESLSEAVRVLGRKVNKRLARP